MARKHSSGCRRLILILGDQLDMQSAALEGVDRDRDTIWMAEVAGESTQVWSHKARIAFFLSAMRHYRNDLERRRYAVRYRALDDPDNRGGLGEELRAAIEDLAPERLIAVEPGEWRAAKILEETTRTAEIPLEVRRDRHFICSREEFAEHAAGRRQLRMEYFYRAMRRRHRVLTDGGKPEGGTWNLDAENRIAFAAKGPGAIPAVRSFRPDAVTRAVLSLVERLAGGERRAIRRRARELKARWSDGRQS